jgi:hypothetical protein
MTKLNLRDGMYGYESAFYYYRSTSDTPKLALAATGNPGSAVKADAA